MGTPPKVEKSVHKMSNWVMTGYQGKLVLIGDCYTRFPDADHPRVITSELICFSLGNDNKAVAETQNSIYELGEMKQSFEIHLKHHGVSMYSLCFDRRNNH